ncbi:hypothetical protein D3C78_1394750 [compost metagenome]
MVFSSRTPEVAGNGVLRSPSNNPSRAAVCFAKGNVTERHTTRHRINDSATNENKLKIISQNFPVSRACRSASNA